MRKNKIEFAVVDALTYADTPVGDTWDTDNYELWKPYADLPDDTPIMGHFENPLEPENPSMLVVNSLDELETTLRTVSQYTHYHYRTLCGDRWRRAVLCPKARLPLY